MDDLDINLLNTHSAIVRWLEKALYSPGFTEQAVDAQCQQECACGHTFATHNMVITKEKGQFCPAGSEYAEVTSCRGCRKCKRFAQDNLEWLTKNK